MSRILLLEATPGPLAAAPTDADLEIAGDLDACLERLADRDAAPHLVAIAASWPQPLTAARRIRRASATVGLALLVPEPDVSVARTRLALAPEVTHAVVLADDPDATRLRTALDEAAAGADRRGQVRRALDTINRSVLGGPPPTTAPDVPSAVPEQYLAALVEHAPDLILSVDPHGRVVTLNEFGERLLATTGHAAEGQPLEHLLRTEDPDEVRELLATDGTGEVRRELRLDGGREVALLLAVTSAPMHDDTGAVLGHVIIGRDVTHERHSEERLRYLQQAESLATLAGGVAHDFNNLLVGIQGWASVAQGSRDDPELVGQALDQILDASGRAAELARSMLVYSGRGSIEFTTVDVGELVTGMTRLLRSSVPPKARLEVEDTGSAPPVRADATQLRQVLMNLVINAGEAIGDQQGRIIVRVTTTDVGTDQVRPRSSGPLLPGRYVGIEVADDGPGVTDDVLERIFDPFFSTKFAGRGLGLAASAGIAGAHGGAIEVEGRPGVGACFRLLLPLSYEGPR